MNFLNAYMNCNFLADKYFRVTLDQSTDRNFFYLQLFRFLAENFKQMITQTDLI